MATKELYGEFLRDAQRSIAHPALSDVPLRVLEEARRSSGQLSQAELRAACSAPNHRDDRLAMEPADALDLLQAAGLLRVEGSPWADPVVAYPVASILNLPRPERRVGTMKQQLVADFQRLRRLPD